jgi:lysozyme family protein
MSSHTIVRNTADVGSYRIYVDNIGANTLNSATAPGSVDGMTIGAITVDNTTTPKSMLIPVSGGVHATISQIAVAIALSGGGFITRPVVIRNDNSVS